MSTKSKSSKYTGVYRTRSYGRDLWTARYIVREGEKTKYVTIRSHEYTEEGERNAALDYDKKMIALGLPPVNILKKKKDENN